MSPEETTTTRVMRRTIGQSALGAKRIGHLEHIIAEFVNVVSEEWIIIVHGNYELQSFVKNNSDIYKD